MNRLISFLLLVIFLYATSSSVSCEPLSSSSLINRQSPSESQSVSPIIPSSEVTTPASSSSVSDKLESAQQHPSISFDSSVDAPAVAAPLSYDLTVKKQYWTVYWFFNFCCVILSVGLMVVVIQNPRRTTSDVLVGSLSFAVFVHAICCGTQCFISYLNGHFMSGANNVGCYAEALYHIVFFDTIMGSLALISYDSRVTVETGKSIGIKRVLQFQVAQWILAPLTMSLFAVGGSPIVLSPSGLFCFFMWNSPLMYAGFGPLFVVTTVVLAVNYYRIFRVTSATLKQLNSTITSQSNKRKVAQMRLAQKLFGFVIMFFIGFGVDVSGVFVAVLRGTGAMLDLDAIGGVFIVVHGCVVPIAYGFINPRIQKPLLRVLTFGLYQGISERSSHGKDMSKDTKEVTSKNSTGMSVTNQGEGSVNAPARGQRQGSLVSAALAGTVQGRSFSAGLPQPLQAGASKTKVPELRNQKALDHLSIGVQFVDAGAAADLTPHADVDIHDPAEVSALVPPMDETLAEPLTPIEPPSPAAPIDTEG